MHASVTVPRQPWKTLKNGFGEPLSIAAQPDHWTQLIGSYLKSADPFENVVCPAGFSILAITDDVDSNFRLLADDVYRRFSKRAVIARQILGFLSGRSQLAKFFRPNQTSYVGG